ncbi:MAG: hypothetical protein V7K18_08950 [Nostoc sp.]|uniref:hypothetical protein n=1 Tax=Nostoc sp. TaxID=1180 RepID=UPI002FFA5EDC
MIQSVERIIPLEIVHPEVQRCFLRCFNDGYKNSNLRPTAGDWVKALRLAVNELTICGKVDSHYYSRTYGKCYWCDRSTKLGVNIFPGKVIPVTNAILNPSAQNITNVKQLTNFQGHSKTVTSVLFSPDGKTIANGSWDNTIKLWDVATIRAICTFQRHYKDYFQCIIGVLLAWIIVYVCMVIIVSLASG